MMIDSRPRRVFARLDKHRHNNYLNMKKSLRKLGAGVPVRLFCLPHAGGGASVFRGWHVDLPQSIEVCPIHLPGREDRLRYPAFTRIEPLVQALAVELVSYVKTPYAFFGH